MKIPCPRCGGALASEFKATYREPKAIMSTWNTVVYATSVGTAKCRKCGKTVELTEQTEVKKT